jgi:dolichol-phosphate mannosyltransferase
MGGKVIAYPKLMLFVNRLAKLFIKFLFNIPLNDTTNAFKAYRKEVIQGCRPLLPPHFNLTVDIPLEAIVRGLYMDIDANFLEKPHFWSSEVKD